MLCSVYLNTSVHTCKRMGKKRKGRHHFVNHSHGGDGGKVRRKWNVEAKETAITKKNQISLKNINYDQTVHLYKVIHQHVYTEFLQ